VRPIDKQIEDCGEHSSVLSGSNERQTTLAALLDKWIAMADLLDLSGSDLMALNVTDVPRIPNQATNFDHAGSV